MAIYRAISSNNEDSNTQLFANILFNCNLFFAPAMSPPASFGEYLCLNKEDLAAECLCFTSALLLLLSLVLQVTFSIPSSTERGGVRVHSVAKLTSFFSLTEFFSSASKLDLNGFIFFPSQDFLTNITCLSFTSVGNVSHGDKGIT